MRIDPVEFCRPVADDDKLLRGTPIGCCVRLDGILYVRQSEWLPFLEGIQSGVKVQS